VLMHALIFLIAC